jgi:glycerophosphoryl diester phosphodiesterase
MNIKYTLLGYVIAVCTAFSVPADLNDIKDQGLIDTLHYSPNQDQHFVSAHRGGRYIKGLPENTIPTFEHTLKLIPDALLEMDVNITADGVLILMHDKSLERTTTASGLVSKSYWSDISNERLIDDFGGITPYRIPKFIDVLKWAKPRGVILKVDIKRGVPYEKVIRTIEKYKMKNQVILITYTIEGVEEAYGLTQEMMISATIRNMDEWYRIQKTNIPVKNLIAFTGTKMSSPELYQTLHANGILCILGTMGNIDKKAEAKGLGVYHECMKAGVDILATDNPEAAGASIRSYKK